MNSLDHMLRYAAHGWPVFLLSATKVPVALCGDECRAHRSDPAACESCDCLMCHGFYAATRDPDRIKEMVRRRPDGCVAIRTGAPSGLVVIDIDPPAGLKTLATLDEDGLLPGTLMAMTTRDCGLHLYYAYPGLKIRQGAGKLGDGVDVKSDGGYVLAPPSLNLKSGRRYMWAGDGRFDHPLTPLHPEVVERLKPPPPASDRHVFEGPQAAFWSDFQHAGSSPRNRMRGLLNAVLNAPNGHLNNTLIWASCRAGEMVAAGEVDKATAERALLRAAEEAGHPTGSAERTIASGIGRTL